MRAMLRSWREWSRNITTHYVGWSKVGINWSYSLHCVIIIVPITATCACYIPEHVRTCAACLTCSQYSMTHVMWHICVPL